MPAPPATDLTSLDATPRKMTAVRTTRFYELPDAIARILENHFVTPRRKPFRPAYTLPAMTIQADNWEALREEMMTKVKPSVEVDVFHRPPVAVTVDMDSIKGIHFGDVDEVIREMCLAGAVIDVVNSRITSIALSIITPSPVICSHRFNNKPSRTPSQRASAVLYPSSNLEAVIA
ncbi:hypothetical protein I350_04547 [Cryptococcus amylolentus CBS 6273]|uniref:Uncharacterized protein n=1 Tax=Cryptococcus amylolentus CBS 6273 TaxID=1296118 RepID=A0A1E3JXL0_9TREE|nr:hypothetical protein I350_04547 [Cryptococcus amylolentus CBS 6273]